MSTETLEAPRWWRDERRFCNICTPKRCTCGPFCRNCGELLGRYKGQPRPERCSLCLFETPTSFDQLVPTGDDELDAQRAAALPRAVLWWAKLRRKPPVLPWLICRIASLVDRGQAEGQPPAAVFRKAAEHLGNRDNAFDGRLACSAFTDAHGGDLELLIVSWCASRRRGAAGRD